MPALRIEVLTGSSAGTVTQHDASEITVGRAPDAGVSLPDTHVSGYHLRLVAAELTWCAEDLRSTNGTVVLRDGLRRALTPGTPLALEPGDVLELGGDGDAGDVTQLRVSFEGEQPEPQVVSVRPIVELSRGAALVEQNAATLGALYSAQKAIGRADDLDSVLSAVADAALSLVPGATHVTLVLREDGDGPEEVSFVPVLSRKRGAPTTTQEAIPITRSVYRHVIRARAAIVAADAPNEGFSSESLLGASIRSTLGVPLWKGDEILGVLQLDNRDHSHLFTSADLDVLGVLAANASLAVAHARTIRKLTAAEERLRRENSFLKRRERARAEGVDIIGHSRAMQELLARLDKVADTRATVLIEGETGVGKELIASALHYRSRRRDKLWVAQNCAALPENLLESELFGHKRGAFTGATEDKKGLFEVADGGTLFLDEVSEIPLALQAKLLRVLQQGELRPLGSTVTKSIDVRIVAACNRDLEHEVEQGRFREDLYYRLKVFPIRVPPLRERREDVPALLRHFLARFTREFGKPVAGFSQAALELLSAYDWPGNVRELVNEVQRGVLEADPDGFVDVDHLSPRVRQAEAILTRAAPPRGTLKAMLEHVERQLITECLREHGNNKTNAAKALGITREGLHKKLRQLKLG